MFMAKNITIYAQHSVKYTYSTHPPKGDSSVEKVDDIVITGTVATITYPIKGQTRTFIFTLPFVYEEYTL